MPSHSADWGYFDRRHSDGTVEVVSVDWALQARSRLRAERTWSVAVTVPRPRLPDAASLSAFQDKLSHAMAVASACTCAARIDGADLIRFYYYCSTAVGGKAEVLSADWANDPRVIVRAEPDPAWSVYLGQLLPQNRAEQMQFDNGKVLAELHRQDDRSNLPHMLHHWLLVRGEADAAACANMLAPYGIKLALTRLHEHQSFKMAIRFDQQVPQLSLQVANEAVLNFVALAAQVGCYYDGWQTQVVR